MINTPDYNKLEAISEYLADVPYDINRTELYSPAELYNKYCAEDNSSFEACYDTAVYRHFIATGKRTSCTKEKLARTLHDHCIGIAMDKFLARYEKTQVVGIMGGHSASRCDEMYARVAQLSKALTEQGFLMVSGGGPGAMEATHLGAWMAGRTDAELADAIATLSIAPTFKHNGWLSTAFKVIEKYPQSQYHSLGIPTWLYGHEPASPFATHIAKLFENSIREDGILTVAFGGIIYSPGSAGTVQEIFQEAVQNHYLSFGLSSPMVFLGTKFWQEEMPIYPMLKSLEQDGKYKNLLLSITDSPQEIINTIVNFHTSRKHDIDNSK